MFASQQVAARVLNLVARRFFRDRALRDQEKVRRPAPGTGWDLTAKDLAADASGDEIAKRIKTIIDRESVVHLDDLVIRRTTLWEDGRRWVDDAEQLVSPFDWDRQTKARELARLEQALSPFSVERC